MGWGISRLIGLKALVLLSTAYFVHGLGMKLLSLPLIYACMIALLISIASHPSVDLPLLLGKASNGIFPLWSWIIFSPFLLFIHLFVLFRRFVKNEPLYTEIADGVYVGGWPSSVERLPPGEPAVIDCTCELPRSSTISETSYLCVATWDTRAPQPSQIESAVRWAVRKRSQNKPVYVHCAYGHGRSVCVMCALLVALGLADDWKAAEQMIREKRPSISMNTLHRKSLEEWSKHLLSPSRSGESDGRGSRSNSELHDWNDLHLMENLTPDNKFLLDAMTELIFEFFSPWRSGTNGASTTTELILFHLFFNHYL